ncbi:MAG: toxin-antitoxin system, antitoxin component [Deltaproteobacteria bacterium]|nr:toxin-antitoxin system, antitoxin component [Deltaproteobacteria bacterium]
MPTKNPRINVVIERPLYEAVARLAKKDGVSLSLKMRDLVKEALEMEEDVALSAFAEGREKTFKKGKALKHEEVW